MRKGILSLALVAVLVATTFTLVHKTHQNADPGTGGRYLVTSQDKTL